LTDLDIALVPKRHGHITRYGYPVSGPSSLAGESRAARWDSGAFSTPSTRVS